MFKSTVSTVLKQLFGIQGHIPQMHQNKSQVYRNAFERDYNS